MLTSLNSNGCLFYIGGRPIENVTSYSHIGHIINCHSDHKDDALRRRYHFNVQANNVFRFFKTLDMHIQIKEFKLFCSSIYSSELWSLEDDIHQDFCCSSRTALRCLLNSPFDAHCFLLSILTCTLPVFYEICKRSSRFINSCLRSRHNLVHSIAHQSIVHDKYYSPIRFCCRSFG